VLFQIKLHLKIFLYVSPTIIVARVALTRQALRCQTLKARTRHARTTRTTRRHERLLSSLIFNI
jgi:hypothetical protein